MTPKCVLFANSEDLDEIPHDAVFYQGLHVATTKTIFGERSLMHFYLETM